MHRTEQVICDTYADVDLLELCREHDWGSTNEVGAAAAFFGDSKKREEEELKER